MKKLLLLILSIISSGALEAQLGEEFASYFEEAYQTYRDVPPGVLEAVAYTKTRIQHLVPRVESCQGLPYYVTVMGLVEDGKGYFKNTLDQIASISGYPKEEIKSDPRICILAYAAAYTKLKSDKSISARSVSNHEPILSDLSEIPEDGSAHNNFAHDQEFFSILREIEQPHTHSRIGIRQSFDYGAIFGETTYQILRSPSVTISPNGIRNIDGIEYKAPQGLRTANCTSTNNATDYVGAVWVPAHPNNYGSRNGVDISHVTVHTIQGSYASAISWFKHSAARVSAHYIIRASDGQVTQMVCEKDKAFHVRTDNDKAVGIEHEGFVEDGFVWYTQKMYESSAKLVQDISRRNDIDPRMIFAGPGTRKVNPLSNECYRIKGHQHFRDNTHVDPGEFWDWDYYQRLINGTPNIQRFTSNKGEIFDSGGKTGAYKELERQAYLIAPSKASSINLEFASFELEGNSQQAFDYLLVYDGEGPNGRLIGKYTGNQLPPNAIANSGKAFIEFRSDCKVNGSGFHIKYTSTKKGGQCPVPEDLTVNNLLPMAATLSWKAATSADQYQVYYRSNLADPSWTRLATDQTSVTITGLAAGNLYEWQVRSICNNDTSGWVGSNFRTRAISRKGSPFNIRITLAEGYFRDSGGKRGTYVDNEAYIYTIISPSQKPIKITFSEFDTENDLDILTIYDGANTTSSAVIGLYSGSEIPETITSSGGALTFKFTSDNRTVKEGWSAYWTTVNDGSSNGGDTGNNGSGNPDNNPISPPISSTQLDPKLNFSSSSPKTEIPLKDKYTSSFLLSFNDIDRSGRGLANRFYSVAEINSNGFSGNPNVGFLYDDFNGGLSSGWQTESGNWRVNNGILQQVNPNEENANIYTPLTQNGNETYLYHFITRMSGKGKNKRVGFHFFSDNPTQENRVILILYGLEMLLQEIK